MCNVICVDNFVIPKSIDAGLPSLMIRVKVTNILAILLLECFVPFVSHRVAMSCRQSRAPVAIPFLKR